MRQMGIECANVETFCAKYGSTPIHYPCCHNSRSMVQLMYY